MHLRCIHSRVPSTHRDHLRPQLLVLQDELLQFYRMPSISPVLTPSALWVLLIAMWSTASVSGDDDSGDSSEEGGGDSSEDIEDGLGNNSSVEYFSVPAFFICLRETIEVNS